MKKQKMSTLQLKTSVLIAYIVAITQYIYQMEI